MKLSATYIALLSNAFFVESKLVRTRHSIKNTKQSEEQRLAGETSASQHDEATALSQFKHEGIERPFEFTSDRADTDILSRNLSNEETKEMSECRNMDVVVCNDGYRAVVVKEMSECLDIDVVVCDDGYVADSDGKTTCVDACGVKCCVGDLACEGFTGSVSKDGKSCMGEEACRDANIGTVFDGCHGYYACSGVGRDGSINSIKHSCNADEACRAAASLGGSIDSIVHSCNAYEACDSAARGGRINSIVHSCNAKWGCESAANHRMSGPNHRESIESGIQHCCNSAEECRGATEETIQDKCMRTPTSRPTTILF